MAGKGREMEETTSGECCSWLRKHRRVVIFFVALQIILWVIYKGARRYHKPTDTVVFLELACVSLAIAIYQIFLDSPALGRAVQQIIDETSTQYLDQFPKHLDHLKRMIEKAESNLLIMVDCVDYGSFSDPQLHDEIVYAIKRRRHEAIKMNKTFNVTMIITDPQPISKSSKFFGRRFEDLQSDEEFKKIFERYLKSNRDILLDSLKNDHAFRCMLQERQYKVAKELIAAGVDIQISGGKKIEEIRSYALEYNAEMVKRNISDLFFWIADKRDAIFLYAYTGTKTVINHGMLEAREMAFKTSDPRLLHVFTDIFSRALPNRPHDS
jgi:hypothetical protein